MNVLFNPDTAGFLLQAAHRNSAAREACSSMDAVDGRLCEHLESFLCSAGMAGVNLMALGRLKKDMHDAGMLDPDRRYRYKQPSATWPHGRLKVSHKVCMPHAVKQYCEQEHSLKRQLNRMARQCLTGETRGRGEVAALDDGRDHPRLHRTLACDRPQDLQLTDTTRRNVLAHVVPLETLLLHCVKDIAGCSPTARIRRLEPSLTDGTGSVSQRRLPLRPAMLAATALERVK